MCVNLIKYRFLLTPVPEEMAATITSNHRKTDVNVVALVNRFLTSRV